MEPNTATPPAKPHPMHKGATNELSSNIFAQEAQTLGATPIKEYEKAKITGEKPPEEKLPGSEPGQPPVQPVQPVGPMPVAPGAETPEQRQLREANKWARNNQLVATMAVGLKKNQPPANFRLDAETYKDLVDGWLEFVKENPGAKMPWYVQIGIINVAQWGVHFIDQEKLKGLLGQLGLGGLIKKAPAQQPQQQAQAPAQQASPANAAAKPPAATPPASAAPANPAKKKVSTVKTDRGTPPKCLCGCGNNVKWVNGKWQKYLNIEHSNRHKALTGQNKPDASKFTGKA